MFDKLLDWLLSPKKEEVPPKSFSHIEKETAAEALFLERTLELKLTQEDRNCLRRRVSSISKKVSNE